MASCYRCGQPIEAAAYHFRRRVKTGGYERRRYGRGRVDLVQSHYGMRIVCRRCARAIDFQDRKLRIEGDMQVVAALVLMILALLFARYL